MTFTLVPERSSIGMRYSAILPPPTTMTFFDFLLRRRSSCVSRTSSVAGAVTYILSPAERRKLPSGMTVSPFRTTTQTSARTRILLYISMSLSPSSGLPSVTSSSTISALPSAKVSRFTKAGNCSSLNISLAASCSGFIAIERRSSSFSSWSCMEYSLSRTRAIVF